MIIEWVQFIPIFMLNINQCFVVTLFHFHKLSDAADVTCAKDQYVSTLSDGNFFCKNCSACRPGQNVVSPCKDDSDVNCATCPTGLFSDGNSGCIKCTVCAESHQEISSCTSSTDRNCAKCPPKEYFKSKICWKCSNCPRGYYMKSACDLTSDTVCDICPPYTYSDGSGMSRCKPCRPCGHFEEVINLCNTTNNVLCGECKKEYYRDGITGTCLRCSECYNEYESMNVRIPECSAKSPDPSKICMPIFPPPFKEVTQITTLAWQDRIPDEETTPLYLILLILAVVLFISLTIVLINWKCHFSKSTKPPEKKEYANDETLNCCSVLEKGVINETPGEQNMNKAKLFEEKGLIQEFLIPSSKAGVPIPESIMKNNEKKRHHKALLLFSRLCVRHSNPILLTDTDEIQMYRGNRSYRGYQTVVGDDVIRSMSCGHVFPNTMDV